MREIKFRHYDGKYMQLSDEHTDLGDYFVFFDDVEKLKYMQYTGLKDKNGVEIYEGDIVKSKSKFYSTELAVVEWLEKRCGFYYIANTIGRDLINRDPYKSAYKMNSKSVEVIGNIYENKELLKG